MPADPSLQDQLQEVRGELQKVSAELERLAKSGREQELLVQGAMALMDSQEQGGDAPPPVAAAEPRCVVNCDPNSRKLHAISGLGLAGDAAGWGAECGWRFGRSRAYRLGAEASELDFDSVCDRCLLRRPEMLQRK